MQERPTKIFVYTPHGMQKAFRELSKKADIKNRVSKMNILAEAVNVMNDGREQRRTSMAKVPIMEQPTMDIIDRSLIEKEIKYVRRAIEMLDDLKNHQPAVDAVEYDNFTLMCNKFAAGINHHLRGMLRAASDVPAVDDLRAEITSLMQQPTRVAPTQSNEAENVKVRFSSVYDGTSAFHLKVLEVGSAIENAMDKEARQTLADQLKAILNDPDVNVNAQDEHGNTVLHLAAEYGLPRLAKILLEDGRINRDILNDNDMSAIRTAKVKADKARAEYNRQTGDATKPTSKYATVHQLLCPIQRRQTAELLKENAKSNAIAERSESFAFLLNKQALNFSMLPANISVMGAREIFNHSINKYYVNHHAMERDRMNAMEIGKSELTKIFNPLNAISAGLCFVNTGLRVMVDKLFNKVTGRGIKAQTGGLVTAIIKAIVTAPFTIAEAVVGGISDLINLTANAIADKITTANHPTTTKLQDDTQRKFVSSNGTSHQLLSKWGVSSSTTVEKAVAPAIPESVTLLESGSQKPLTANKSPQTPSESNPPKPR